MAKCSTLIRTLFLLIWVMIFFMVYYVECRSIHGVTTIPIVNSTQLGVIRGRRASDGDYDMYLGIPYARVNLSNPFGPSIPETKYDEPLYAYDDSVECPQFARIDNKIVGHLDCLRLNIFVPDAASKSNPLAVLIWIYGGGGMTGFASTYWYNPKYLVRHGIITITFNYRLGPYGFMCLDTTEASGNEGLKDQMKALNWVYRNIAHFGGDPTKITVCGHSSAGGDVDMHLQHEENNFIDKVLLGSGVASVPGYMKEPDKEASLKLAKHLGSSTDDLDESLAFLATVDPTLVTAAVNETGMDFGPCIETKSIKPFITEHPAYIKTPKVELSAVLLSNTNQEGYYLKEITDSDSDFDLYSLSEDLLETLFDFSEERLNEMKFVKHFYVGDDTGKEMRQGLVNLIGDFKFRYPIERQTQMFLNKGMKSIYRYMFSYKGERNLGQYALKFTVEGAAHADELGYIWGNSLMNNLTDKDQHMMDTMTTVLANFVKFGNPTPYQTDLLPIKWEPVTNDSLYTLHLDSTCNLTLVTRPYHQRMVFWDLFFHANKDLIRRL